MVKGYGRFSSSPRCAVKIDLRKAFNSLNWRFVMDILAALNFSPIFINWIRSCITSPKFSISFNGVLVGYFKGAKGVRQRDPLSPYIFVIAMDVLSKLLDAAAAYGVFNYHPNCKRIKLIHLSFADDLLIFMKGNKDSIEGVQKILNVFYTYSGLQLNCDKSEFYCSGVSRDTMNEMQLSTGFKCGSLPVRYLGVPLVTRRLSFKDCYPLFDKMKVRINCWSARLISYARRLQLIKTVLYSIQNFWCHHFFCLKEC